MSKNSTSDVDIIHLKDMAAPADLDFKTWRDAQRKRIQDEELWENRWSHDDINSIMDRNTTSPKCQKISKKSMQRQDILETRKVDSNTETSKTNVGFDPRRLVTKSTGSSFSVSSATSRVPPGSNAKKRRETIKERNVNSSSHTNTLEQAEKHVSYSNGRRKETVSNVDVNHASVRAPNPSLLHTGSEVPRTQPTYDVDITSDTETDQQPEEVPCVPLPMNKTGFNPRELLNRNPSTGTASGAAIKLSEYVANIASNPSSISQKNSVDQIKRPKKGGLVEQLRRVIASDRKEMSFWHATQSPPKNGLYAHILDAKHEYGRLITYCAILDENHQDTLQRAHILFGSHAEKRCRIVKGSVVAIHSPWRTLPTNEGEEAVIMCDYRCQLLGEKEVPPDMVHSLGPGDSITHHAEPLNIQEPSRNLFANVKRHPSTAVHPIRLARELFFSNPNQLVSVQGVVKRIYWSSVHNIDTWTFVIQDMESDICCQVEVIRDNGNDYWRQAAIRGEGYVYKFTQLAFKLCWDSTRSIVSESFSYMVMKQLQSLVTSSTDDDKSTPLSHPLRVNTVGKVIHLIDVDENTVTAFIGEEQPSVQETEEHIVRILVTAAVASDMRQLVKNNEVIDFRDLALAPQGADYAAPRLVADRWTTIRRASTANTKDLSVMSEGPVSSNTNLHDLFIFEVSEKNTNVVGDICVAYTTLHYKVPAFGVFEGEIISADLNSAYCTLLCKHCGADLTQSRDQDVHNESLPCGSCLELGKGTKMYHMDVWVKPTTRADGSEVNYSVKVKLLPNTVAALLEQCEAALNNNSSIMPNANQYISLLNGTHIGPLKCCIVNWSPRRRTVYLHEMP